MFGAQKCVGIALAFAHLTTKGALHSALRILSSLTETLPKHAHTIAVVYMNCVLICCRNAVLFQR